MGAFGNTWGLSTDPLSGKGSEPCIFTLLCFFAKIDLPRLLDSRGGAGSEPIELD